MVWANEQGQAFKTLKTAPVLQQVNPGKPFTIKSDAISYALGAVLLQGEGPDEQPIEYVSPLHHSRAKLQYDRA